MSEDTTDLPVPGADRSSRPNPDATVLPFPSNHPPAEADRDAVQLRLRDVIGDVLRAERLRQERTLADVAREAAVSLPYLSEVERGRKEVSSDVLDAIGTALELPLVELLERSADRLRIDGATAPTSIGSGEFRMQSSTRFQLAA